MKLPLDNEIIKGAVEKAKMLGKQRKFKQTVELIVALKDINLKGNEGKFREVVYLPHAPSKEPNICVIASGDLLLEAKKLGLRTISREELSAMKGNKKAARNIGNSCDWILVSSDLMSLVGSILGPALGPRGKVPIAISPKSNISDVVNNYKRAVWARIRNEPQIQCKVGTEDMKNEEIIDNINAVFNTIESKIGIAKIARVYVKKTMGFPVEIALR
ncbi:50S ribosomal protein L1 [Caldisphaera lagunensis]|uniref:50S ribosomal protein L1 n=1 Tax=Caldisphaera lagunensis TaxID=200415 RepID=UPI0012FCD01A